MFVVVRDDGAAHHLQSLSVNISGIMRREAITLTHPVFLYFEADISFIMQGCMIVFLITLTQIGSVKSLICYDCGPLYLPSSQCSKTKDCTTGYCTYCKLISTM
jgi:hypothetical protein